MLRLSLKQSLPANAFVNKQLLHVIIYALTCKTIMPPHSALIYVKTKSDITHRSLVNKLLEKKTVANQNRHAKIFKYSIVA